MRDEIKIKLLDAGSADHDSIIQMVEIYRMATVANMAGEGTDPNELARAMVAAVIYAGSIFGALIVAGFATDQDKRRACDSMVRNFRSGIEVGKIKATRLAKEGCEGRA